MPVCQGLLDLDTAEAGGPDRAGGQQTESGHQQELHDDDWRHQAGSGFYHQTDKTVKLAVSVQYELQQLYLGLMLTKNTQYMY